MRVKLKTKSNFSTETIVKEKKINISKLDKLNAANHLSAIKATGNKIEAKTFVLFFDTPVAIEILKQNYFKTGLFSYVELNYIGSTQGVSSQDFTPNDTWTYPWQWYLYNDGTFADASSIAGADINMYPVWDFQQGDSDITVAVLDSGALVSHQEFDGRIWVNSGETMDGTDSDNNGYVDDVNGWSFFDESSNLEDATGHGTNVTGIIGANGNNNIGYTGIDWNCKLMILKILDDDGNGFYSWWADAIYYAVDNGADVINMSVAGLESSILLEDAVNYAYENNVAIIAASGNFNENFVRYPAAYENTIAVGATNTNDFRCNPFSWGGGSNYGGNLDLVAPGDRIYGLNYVNDTDFSWYWSGTSQATPMVTGVVSLMLAEFNTLTPDQIRTILHESSEDEVGLPTEDIPGFDVYYGYGRLNALEAINYIPLGLNDMQNISLEIYPNPIEDTILNISLSKNGNATIVLYNTLGQIVLAKEKETINKRIQLTTTNLKSGIYFVQVTIDNSSITKKIIVK